MLELCHLEDAAACCTLSTRCQCFLQMEVGIEDCLHIEFEYDKSKYHLKDTVVGKIYFLLVRPFMLLLRVMKPPPTHKRFTLSSHGKLRAMRRCG